jgi:hypothetical protein
VSDFVTAYTCFVDSFLKITINLFSVQFSIMSSSSSEQKKKSSDAVSRRCGRTAKSWRMVQQSMSLPKSYYCAVCDVARNYTYFRRCDNAKCQRLICILCAAKANTTTCKACALAEPVVDEVKTKSVAVWETEYACYPISRADVRRLSQPSASIPVVVSLSNGTRLKINLSATNYGELDRGRQVLQSQAVVEDRLSLPDEVCVRVQLSDDEEYAKNQNRDLRAAEFAGWSGARFVAKDDAAAPDDLGGEDKFTSLLWLMVDVAVKKKQ